MPTLPRRTRVFEAEYATSRLEMCRRIGCESITMVGGGRATLMQLAHPLVAAGVNEHSYFRQDPMTRLARTMDLMLTVVFGNGDQVQTAVRKFNAVHTHVYGSLKAAQGIFSEGYGYSARDPMLKLWVHATLIDTSLVVYQRFVRALSNSERARFYDESKTIGGWLGIPREVYPATLDDFAGYIHDMTEGDILAVTPVTRMLAREVLNPQTALLTRLGVRLVLFATPGLLPDRLRRDYQLQWSNSQERLLQTVSTLYRIARPVAPKSIALMPRSGGGQLIGIALRRYGLNM